MCIRDRSGRESPECVQSVCHRLHHAQPRMRSDTGRASGVPCRKENNVKIVAGNWKMFKTIEEARTYFAELATATPPQGDKVRVIVFPNYIALGALAETGSVPAWVLLGAQDAAAEVEGAFTGEVSPAMIRSTGATHVLIGHSERRHIIGESADLLHRKLVNSLEASLIPVSVSYTHLRAHETRHDLVCRLLLEK